MDFIFVQDHKGDIEHLKWDVRVFNDFSSSLAYLIQCENWITNYELADHFVVWDVDNENTNIVRLAFSNPKVSTLFNLIYIEDKE